MDKFESERKPRLLNAKSLVNFIAHAGPGSSLQVRIRFKNRIIALGKTAWSDDRVGGPSVTFPNPKNKKERRGGGGGCFFKRGIILRNPQSQNKKYTQYKEQ